MRRDRRPPFAPCSGPGSDPRSRGRACRRRLHLRGPRNRCRPPTRRRTRAASRSTRPAPTVSVDSGPNGPTLDSDAHVQLLSRRARSTFTCQVDGRRTSQRARDRGRTFSPRCARGRQVHAATSERRTSLGISATASRSFNLTAAACRQALNDVIAANGAVAKAEAKLLKAKASGNAREDRRRRRRPEEGEEGRGLHEGRRRVSCASLQMGELLRVHD